MKLNRAALIVKVGDQPAKLESQYATMKNGMPISLIMERDWGKPLEEICPPNKVFAIVEVNPDLEAFYMDMLQPLNPEKELDARYYRARKRILPLNTIAAKVNDSMLSDKLFSKDVVPILDGRSLKASDFLDALLFTPAVNIVEDKNAITSGSYNVGSGETYTTFTAAFADVGAGLTGDLTFTQISNITETSIAYSDADVGGYTLAVTSDAESYGFPNVGYITTINHTGVGMDIVAQDTGTFNFSKFYLRSTSASYSFQPLFRISGNDSVTAYIHDIMLDGNNGGGQSQGHAHCFIKSTTYVTLKAWNLQCWHAGSTGIQTVAMNANDIIENCVAYGCYDIGFWFRGQVFNARNLLALGNAYDYHQTASLSQFDKCASSDTTGSEAGLRSLTAANQVNSLDDTNSEFLNITPGSTIDGAGTTSILTENTEDIRNNPRPTVKGLVSCGATEPPKGSIITLRGGFGSSLMGGFQ